MLSVVTRRRVSISFISFPEYTSSLNLHRILLQAVYTSAAKVSKFPAFSPSERKLAIAFRFARVYVRVVLYAERTSRAEVERNERVRRDALYQYRRTSVCSLFKRMTFHSLPLLSNPQHYFGLGSLLYDEGEDGDIVDVYPPHPQHVSSTSDAWTKRALVALAAKIVEPAEVYLARLVGTSLAASSAVVSALKSKSVVSRCVHCPRRTIQLAGNVYVVPPSSHVSRDDLELQTMTWKQIQTFSDLKIALVRASIARYGKDASVDGSWISHIETVDLLADGAMSRVTLSKNEAQARDALKSFHDMELERFSCGVNLYHPNWKWERGVAVVDTERGSILETFASGVSVQV